MATVKTLSRAPQQPERRAALGMTGRYLVTMQKGSHEEISAKLSKTGFKAASPIPPGAIAAKALPQGSQIRILGSAWSIRFRRRRMRCTPWRPKKMPSSPWNPNGSSVPFRPSISYGAGVMQSMR